MGYVNQKAKGFREEAHLNFMAGLSYDISNPINKLKLAASSCFFGEPMYYHRDEEDKRPSRQANPDALDNAEVKYLRKILNALDPIEWRSLTPASLMEKCIDEAIEFNLEETLKVAVSLRQDDFIRTTPQVILVRAANHKSSKGPKASKVAGQKSLIRVYAEKIIARADEPAVGLAYQISKFGKPVPNSLKKAWAEALQRFNEYQLAKYRMENHVVKTVDVANISHPKAEAVSKLMKGELTVTGKTWEAIISADGSNTNSWTKAVDVMGHMALLRNLRNLIENGVGIELFKQKLLDGAIDGKQLPFRYYSAYKAVEHIAPPSLQDAIEDCLTMSLGNLPHFDGKVMSLCDNSGSAKRTTTSKMGTMQIATIGNLTGIITGKVADEGYVGIFGDRLETFAVRKNSSIFEQLKKSDSLGDDVGGGTENGIWLFWDKAIKEKQHWDHVFVYSDMQAGHGGLYGVDQKAYKDFLYPGSSNGIDVPKLISTYRSKVNRNVMIYLVQIAGYQDTIVPEFYDKTFIFGGWGDGLLRFAAEMCHLNMAGASDDARKLVENAQQS